MTDTNFNSNSNRRYELVQKIACGGTAEVWRAIQTGSIGFKKTVALKKILSSSRASRELRELLIDEAKVLCHLQHSSIVQVLELCEDESDPFIAMEFVDGIDCQVLLSRLIRNRTRAPIGISLYVAAEALTALDFAHKKSDENGNAMQIVHRDVSPSNILISWNGEVKLTDFGIAKGLHRSELTNAGTLKGKFAYMSPEQASGGNIDSRSDIYSLGIVVIELLLGKKLFDAESDLSLLNIVKSPPKFSSDLHELPREVRSIILSALSPSKKLRYQSAAQMLQEVRNAQKKLGLIATCVEMAEYLSSIFLAGERRANSVSEVDHTGEWHENELVIRDIKTSRMCLGSERKKSSARTAFNFILIMIFTMPLFATRSDSYVRKIEKAVHVNADIVKKAVADGNGIKFRSKQNIENIASPPKVTPKKQTTCLYVSAKPWGKVALNGGGSKETPATFCGVDGEQLISVTHPPSGKKIGEAVIASGQNRISCAADLLGKPKMFCR